MIVTLLFLTAALAVAVVHLFKRLQNHIMTSAEVFTEIAAATAQNKKAFGEIRTLIDAQGARITALEATETTPEQDAILRDMRSTAQQLDDIVPDGPADPPAAPVP